MDKRLIILIAVFCSVSVAFFVYKKVYYKHDGLRYTIKPGDGLMSLEDPLVFQDQTDGANRWKWDFGDGEYSAAASGSHTYMAPGRYDVKLTAYGSFGVLKNDSAITIVVRNGNQMPKAAQPTVLGPAQVEVGKPAKFESSMGAATYEWHVEGDSKLTGKTDKGGDVTYTFASAGVRTVILKTTQPDAEARMSVTVSAAAPVAAPAPQPKPAQPMPMPKPQPRPQQQKPKPHGNLPDLDNGVEYEKNH